MAALMRPRHDFDEYEDIEQIEIGRAPARPRLALVGEPRAAVRCSPLTTRATYRRRRILAVVLALGIVVTVGKAGVALGGTPLVAPERPPAPPIGSSFVVRPGDSLWTIAQRIAPGADLRPIVDALARDRANAPLRPGETVEYGG